jgi:hypothetical protein
MLNDESLKASTQLSKGNQNMDTSKLLALMKQKKAALKTKDKTVKPQPGSNRYVLLPGWRKGEEHLWWHDFGQHYIKNAADEIQAVYPCNEAIYGKPCPICDGLNRAQHAASDDETVELLKKAKAGRSYLMNVLALDSEDPNTPQILEVRSTVFGQLVDAVEEWAGSIFDPEAAQVIIVNREGKGLNTKYAVQVSPKKQAVAASVYAKLHNLDEYVMQESEEQKRKALSAINHVAGLLTSSADRPSTARPALAMSDEIVEEAVPAKTTKSAKPTPALEEELDDLLGDLA